MKARGREDERRRPSWCSLFFKAIRVFVCPCARKNEETREREDERGRLSSVIVCRQGSSSPSSSFSLSVSFFPPSLLSLLTQSAPRAPVAVKFPTPGTITASSGLFSLPPFQFCFKKKIPFPPPFYLLFPPRFCCDLQSLLRLFLLFLLLSLLLFFGF